MTAEEELIQEITSVEQFQEVLKSHKIVVMDFYSTQCPPCTVVAPLYHTLANKYPNAKFLKTNGLDPEGYKVQKSVDVVWWPTFLVYVDGVEQWRAKIPNPPQQFPTQELEEVLMKVYQ